MASAIGRHHFQMERSEKSRARAERIARYAASVNLSEHDPATKPIFEGLARFYKGNPKARKIAKKANERSKYLAASFVLNGPGLFVDKYLRSFLEEYNGRLFQGNGDKQPNSFNVLNSFVEPDEKALVLRLLPEIHYSLNLNLILDTLTEPSSNYHLDELPNCCEELNIYEYHVLGGYADVVFGSLKLTFHGLAFVRDGQELCIAAIFGKKVAELESGIPDQEMKVYPGKEFLNKIESVDTSDIEIIAGTSHVPLIALSRLTLNDAKSQARYVLLEKRDTFDVLTSDPSVFEDMKVMGMNEDQIKSSLERLNEYLPIFEFIEQLPLFQNKISELDDLVNLVRYPTGFKIEGTSGTVRKIRKNLPPNECPNYINVVTVDVEGSSAHSFEIEPNNLVIESSGYWQTLPPDKSGTDRAGNVLYGKTWVKTQKSWYEMTNVEVELKEPIAVEIRDTADVGTVYVMRNAQHPKETYKIGFTTKTSDDRAAQLGGTSGQPDGFAIVQDWQVKSPRLVEKEVHNRLRTYRVNDRREFFRLDYREIRKCIEEVIRELAAEA